MPAEQQISRRQIALGVCLAHVVDIDAAALDVLPRLALGRAETGKDQRLGQRRARAFEFAALQIARRNFPDNFIEGAFGNAVQTAAEQNLAGAHGLGCGALAVNQIGHGPGQRLVGGARLRPGLMLRGQRGDFVLD